MRARDASPIRCRKRMQILRVFVAGKPVGGAAIDRRATMVTLSAMTRTLPSRSPRSTRRWAMSTAISRRSARRAAKRRRLGADLVVFSELNVCGYPPEDLVLKPAFQAPAAPPWKRWRARPPMAARPCWWARPGVEDGKLYNAALLLGDGEIAGRAASSTICRITASSTRSGCSPPARRRARSAFRDVRLGVMVCEDMWMPEVTETLAEIRRRDAAGSATAAPTSMTSSTSASSLPARARSEIQPAAHLCQPGRRPGRAGVRRRAPSSLDADCSAEGAAAGLRARRCRSPAGGAGNDGWRCADGEITAPMHRPGRASTRRWCWACATMWTKNRFPGVRAGPLRRHRFRASSAAVAVDALGPTACAR